MPGFPSSWLHSHALGSHKFFFNTVPQILACGPMEILYEDLEPARHSPEEPSFLVSPSIAMLMNLLAFSETYKLLHRGEPCL